MCTLKIYIIREISLKKIRPKLDQDFLIISWLIAADNITFLI